MAKFFFNFQAQFFVFLVVTVVGLVLIIPDIKDVPSNVTVDCIRIETLTTKDEDTGYQEYKCIREKTAK